MYVYVCMHMCVCICVLVCVCMYVCVCVCFEKISCWLVICAHYYYPIVFLAENFNIYEVLLCPVCRSEYKKRPCHNW